MNSNFITATHLMAYLTYAQRRNCLASSKEIAQHIQNNPTVVRRLMQLLSGAGLIVTQKGANGGASLTRPAGEISLLAIFEAVEGEDFDLFSLQAMEREGCSPIINSLQLTLQERLHAVSDAMKSNLATVSIEEILTSSLLRMKDCH